ncbi:MAG: hypothetical protein JO125_15170 [Chloroflexi bacterium]|nr:hypothetical protein [Chloroflexota bacterium]
MAKVSRAPRNFYTAQQAARKLGMKEGAFFYHVRAGKIKKVVPPGSKEGYYPKAFIDKMVEAKELFILEYAAEPSTFEKAIEEDIKSIYELGVSLFGVTEATPYEILLEWHKKNPQTYYVLKQEGIVTGYMGLLYLNKETTEYIMSETTYRTPVPPATEVLPFAPNQPIEGLFVGLGVRPGMGERRTHYHGRHLIAGCIHVLEDFAKRGMPVNKLYATSKTKYGIKLCRDLGFNETEFQGDPLIRFELDLETSNSPWAEKYREVVKQYQKTQKQAINE